MYWDEEQPSDATYRVPDDIVDLAFAIACPCLPLDHACALSQALHAALPWLHDEPRAGIHLIHGAESGNGWYRPQDPAADVLFLSKRTRMTLRLPKARVEDACKLAGSTLHIEGYPLQIREATVRPLSALPTLFARYVAAQENDGEERFLELSARELQALGIPVKKMLCGKSHPIRVERRTLFTRSLMIADLEPDQSVRLQQQGIGPLRKMGCGLFIPHKGIRAINEESNAR